MDPTSERAPEKRQPLPRPAGLEGKTVGLLDISKPKGDVFIDRLEDLLVQKGLATRRYIKPTFTRVSPVELNQKIAAECDVVIESLAD
jgi:hypothetical protein